MDCFFLLILLIFILLPLCWAVFVYGAHWRVLARQTYRDCGGDRASVCVRLFAVCCSSQPAVPRWLILIQGECQILALTARSQSWSHKALKRAAEDMQHCAQSQHPVLVKNVVEKSSLLWAGTRGRQNCRGTCPISLCGELTSSHDFWVTPLLHSLS